MGLVVVFPMFLCIPYVYTCFTISLHNISCFVVFPMYIHALQFLYIISVYLLYALLSVYVSLLYVLLLYSLCFSRWGGQGCVYIFFDIYIEAI